MSIFGSFWKKDSGNTRKAPASGRWQVGDKIANRFEIHQILGGEGKSGMGIVYVCYDYKTKFICALKTFQEKWFHDECTQKLFEREALLWTELERHPYIVRSYLVERLENRLFITLEYIAPDSQSRNTLTHYLGSLTLPDILKFSIQFCYGMEYAYSKGIDCHRDIKPDNIMITADKTVKITDFGLAKALQEIQLKEDIISVAKDKPGLSIFQSNGKRICGTLPYMAPEQFDSYADNRSDVYAFGIVLYQMATGGRLPFIGRTAEEYKSLHKYKDIPSISSPLFPIIQKCVNKKQDKRYQSFMFLREELQRILLQETGEVVTPPQFKELDTLELNNKGFALGSLGRYQEAICCYNKALDINPKFFLCWSNKGAALWSLDRRNEAIACFDKALEISPEYDDGWYGKGFALGKLGKVNESIPYFDKATQINPKYADAWNNKAAGLFILGKYQEALKCIDEAIRLNPNLYQVYELRQLILQGLDG